MDKYSDEPGKPGRPMVTDWDKDRIDIEWDPPLKDGGSPITGYVVEMKDPITKEWVECAEVRGTSASITGLKEGQEYQFRVKAKNKAGAGAPSEPSDKQVAKCRWFKPKIDRDQMRDLTVKAGQTAKWDIKLFGEPPPDVQWFKGDTPCQMSGTLSIDVNRGQFTVLSIQPTVRADGGNYTLKLKNNQGEDSCTATLTVLDRPTKPMGPLNVKDVYEDQCELDWRPPLDDGGCPIDYYEVEKMDAETGQWTPVCKAKDCKAHVDGLRKGQMYHFRVKAVNREGVSDPLVTDTAIKAKNPYGRNTIVSI
jgi:hypothetical protein